MITWAERAKAAIAQKCKSGTAKTDETAFSRLLAVSSVPAVAVSAMSETLSSVLAVHSPIVLENHDSSISVNEDPDRWCWPHSSAMNGAEIDRFLQRTSSYTERGIDTPGAERLADQLVARDRDLDERHTCMECTALKAASHGGWRCLRMHTDPLGGQSSKLPLAKDFVTLLQCCDQFRDRERVGKEELPI